MPKWTPLQANRIRQNNDHDKEGYLSWWFGTATIVVFFVGTGREEFAQYYGWLLHGPQTLVEEGSSTCYMPVADY